MTPVECKEFPGYFEIPGFSKYCINESSDIIHKRKDKIINQYEVKGSSSSRPETGCYRRVTLSHDDGKQRALSVHRLMGIIFKHPGDDVNLDELQVNHIDGIKFHNHISNLEWVTCKKNIQLSNVFYRGKVKIKVQLKRRSDGEVINFPNITSCGNFLGLHRNTLINRLERYGENFVHPEGYQMRYGNSDKDWKTTQDYAEEMETFYTKPLLIKNLFTNEVREFEKLEDCKELLPYTIGRISELSLDPMQPSVWGANKSLYIVIKKFPKKEFRVVGCPYEDIKQYSKSNTVIVATNVETNERKIYASAIACANDFGILKTTLNWRLNRETPRVFEGWIFRRF